MTNVTPELHITVITVHGGIKLRWKSRRGIHDSGDAPFIGRWAIERRYGSLIEPQIDGQLSSMMRQVAEYGVARS